MISSSSLSVKSYDFAIDKLAFVTSSTTLFVTFNSIGFLNPNAFASNLLIIIEPLSQDTYISIFLLLMMLKPVVMNLHLMILKVLHLMMHFRFHFEGKFQQSSC